MNTENYQITVEGSAAELNIKHTIGFEEMVSIVSNVVESCIDTENGEYFPYLFDFSMRINVMRYYGNIEIPDDINVRYNLAYNSDLYSHITSDINQEQLNQIIDSAKAKIDFILNTITSSLSMKISDLVDSFEKILGEIGTENLQNAISLMNRISNMSDDEIVSGILNAKAGESEDG